MALYYILKSLIHFQFNSVLFCKVKTLQYIYFLKPSTITWPSTSNHLVTEGRNNSLSNHKQHQNQPVLWIHIMQLCFTVWPVLICLYTSFHRKHTSAPQIHVKPFPYFYQVCAFTKVDAQNKHDQILNLWLWLSSICLPQTARQIWEKHRSPIHQQFEYSAY